MALRRTLELPEDLLTDDPAIRFSDEMDFFISVLISVSPVLEAQIPFRSNHLPQAVTHAHILRPTFFCITIGC
jgi:hypothetical protein